VAHAHSLSCHLHLCFPAYDRPLPCHQTSPGQQPLRPFPSFVLAPGSEIGKGLLRTPRPVVLAIYFITITTTTHRHQQHWIAQNTKHHLRTKALQHSHSGGEKERIFPDRPACISARYTRLSHMHRYLSRHRHYYNLPLMYEYHEVRHTTLLSPDTPTPGFRSTFFQQHHGLTHKSPPA
jgi:hypothetical protein